MSHILANIKNMLIVVMAINWTCDKYCIDNDANVRDIAISLKKRGSTL